MNIMKPQKTLLALALLASAAVTGTAHASLATRGNGLLYDNVLNVTWLRDANYAKTSGYDADGQMTWNEATTWAANLVYGGYSDWRLATNTPINGSSFNNNYSPTGTTDQGFNITSPKSELAYMYNVNLGLKDAQSTSGVDQADHGVFGNGIHGGQADVGLVKNLQSSSYWSSAEFSPYPGEYWESYFFPDNAFVFETTWGNQASSYKGFDSYAWAVRQGDSRTPTLRPTFRSSLMPASQANVAAVPVPGAVWLFGSALVGLMGFKKRGNIG
jgi:hypothetical protein